MEKKRQRDPLATLSEEEGEASMLVRHEVEKRYKRMQPLFTNRKKELIDRRYCFMDQSRADENCFHCQDNWAPHCMINGCDGPRYDIKECLVCRKYSSISWFCAHHMKFVHLRNKEGTKCINSIARDNHEKIAKDICNEVEDSEHPQEALITRELEELMDQKHLLLMEENQSEHPCLLEWCGDTTKWGNTSLQAPVLDFLLLHKGRFFETSDMQGELNHIDDYDTEAEDKKPAELKKKLLVCCMTHLFWTLKRLEKEQKVESPNPSPGPAYRCKWTFRDSSETNKQ